MVEIEGEKNLSASCIRYPSEGMKVKTFGARVEKNRKLIFKLLASDMPLKENCPDPNSHFWKQYESIGIDLNYRLPAGRPGAQSEIPVKSILNDISSSINNREFRCLYFVWFMRKGLQRGTSQ